MLMACSRLPVTEYRLSCEMYSKLLPCRMQGLEVRVWRDYHKFIDELTQRFPHEKAGIRKFYDECWRVRRASWPSAWRFSLLPDRAPAAVVACDALHVPRSWRRLSCKD